MRKRIFIRYLLILSVMFTFSAVSYADETVIRPYFALKGGASFVESDFDLGYYRGYHYDYWENGYYYNDYYYRKEYDESNDVVFAGSAALGVKTKYVRVEFEYTRRTEANQEYRWFPDLKQEFDSYIANVFFDWPATPNIIPYAGLGLGLTHSKTVIEYEDYEETIFRNRFSIGADVGVSFALARHFNLDCGFKFMYLGTVKIEDEDLNMYAIDMYMGLRYTI